MKTLKWIALIIGGLAAVLLAFGAWLLHAESGARWVASTVSNVLGAKLSVGGVEGGIAGPLTLIDVRYQDAALGVDFSAQRIAIDIALRDLASLVVRVRSAEFSGLNLLLHEPEQRVPPPEEESQPFSLEPPIDVVIDSLVVSDVKIRREDATLLDLTRATFAGHWTQSDLAVEQLEVRSPQGEVQFAGRVDQVQAYVGEGRGRFRWRAGDKTYAGALTTIAEGKDANLTLNLSSPLNARLEVFLEQTEHWPWRFTLEAPRFDPREALLPGSSLHSLAASLTGAGTLERGAINGRLIINDEPLLLEPLRFARAADALSLDATLRIGESGGAMTAKGDVRFESDTWTADASAAWADVVVPAVWAGQELHTRGQLEFHGNPANEYNAAGNVSLGPPDRVADIALKVAGSPDVVQLEQFDIVQSRGRLAATGKVQLKPQMSWNVAAKARRFDPGAFAAAWRGDLNFDLASVGRLSEKGPSATLELTDLSGKLRGRAMSGHADLAVTPTLVPAGTLALRSGESELRFRGKEGEQIDANVSLNVATLNDWLPDSSGQLRADFVIRGRWPELSIEGNARGRELNAADVRVDAFALDASIDDPRNPQGSVQFDLTKLAAAGFEFETVRARASGGAASHRLSVEAAGSPLSLEIGLDGGRSKEGWSGSVQSLVFDVENAVRLSLREPVRIVAANGAVAVSRACLSDGEIELCARGATQSNGALEAHYSLANAPLALANAFASADLPLRFAGVLQGRGDIRRTAAGELLGEVLLESPSGRISRHVVEAEGEEAAEPQSLFSWRDLRIAANLAGERARASVDARFEKNGALSGEVNASGLDQAESPITGSVSASLPDLAPLGVFAPQVANLHGRADARFTIAGALQAPKITGELTATELAADVPALGLHLKNGRIAAQPGENGEIALSGGVESGGGGVAFAGMVSPGGAMEVNINGDRFLAADIPAANVIVTPDLRFVRAEERMTLAGKVTVPEATVNLQKLPRGGDRAQPPSSDVVVIDAVAREEEVEGAPLFADVTVLLGDKVELIGFGLQAQVTGRLDVRERPGETTVGSGEVRVAGTYKAYGQDLTIQQGQLLYAATPLDNPRLNIEATRQVEEVTAGLRVRGTAKEPELTVFSDPPMGQANALSYLVAGKPLDDIDAEEGEGDALQTATRSLGSAAGGLVAKNLGRRLGVDELAVKDDEMIGGSALTVGQYLSPRLYLSYGVGLFEPGEVVTLRYKLSKDFDVKAQRGPEDMRAGIEYRLER